MEHLAFVIWMIFYPFFCTLAHYIGAKRRKIEGEDKPSNESSLFAYTVEIIIWILVAFNVY